MPRMRSRSVARQNAGKPGRAIGGSAILIRPTKKKKEKDKKEYGHKIDSVYLEKAKYSGVCCKCSKPTYKGNPVYWNGASKLTWHLNCDKKPFRV